MCGTGDGCGQVEGYDLYDDDWVPGVLSCISRHLNFMIKELVFGE
jgi:hypothetical protein